MRFVACLEQPRTLDSDSPGKRILGGLREGVFTPLPEPTPQAEVERRRRELGLEWD